MRRYEQVGDGRRPPIWRSVLFALVGGFGTLISAVFSPTGHNPTGWALLISMICLFAAAVLPVLLFWRHRRPFELTIGTAALSLVLPIGNTIPLISLAALLGRRRGPAALWTTVLVGATSAWVVIWDAVHQPVAASVIKTLTSPQGSDDTVNASVSPLGVIAAWVLSFGIALGLGLMVRAQRATASTEQVLVTEREASDRLGDEAARRQERERIAREVHDVMGHRLSLLNLHAGAMEANSGDDPRLQQSAALVRESAGAAMDDLRSLLSVLREPLGDELPTVPLTRLREVVSESFGAGQPLSSSIFIQDAETASPTLSRAVYRIVQELLTNARKHAPGEQLTLLVEGAPDSGIMIDAQNRYRGGWGAAPPGVSRGLSGIAERVELLGGRFNFGLDQGGQVFRAHVELPWTT